jgi:beta-lactamase class A
MLAGLERRILQIANGVAADWAIYVKFLGSGDEIAVNADTAMNTMSVMKVPLIVTLWREAERGRVDLDRRVTIDGSRRRWGTGVLSALDDGVSVTVRDAARLMIDLSDNAATDICFEAVGGPGRVTEHMRKLGLTSIEATGTALDWLRAVVVAADPSAAALDADALYRHGYPARPPIGSNWLAERMSEVRTRFHFEGGRPFGLSTARDMGRLLEMIYSATCADRSSCNAILEILRAQHFDSGMPKYLWGATTAHKTGSFGPFIANDVGIIEGAGRPPVIACFFTTNYRGVYAHLEDSIARMSDKVWDHALASE